MCLCKAVRLFGTTSISSHHVEPALSWGGIDNAGTDVRPVGPGSNVHLTITARSKFNTVFDVELACTVRSAPAGAHAADRLATCGPDCVAVSLFCDHGCRTVCFTVMDLYNAHIHDRHINWIDTLWTDIHYAERWLFEGSI